MPEYLGPACRPAPIAEALDHLMTDKDARDRQIAAMDLTLQRLGLGQEAPGLRAARSVLRSTGLASA